MLHRNSAMILQAILNKPRDKDAKRAYADALIEEGEEGRGYFINAQIGHNFLLDYTYDNLDKELAVETLPLSLRKSMRVLVVDGFISSLALKHNQFLKHAEFLFSRHPIIAVNLIDRTPEVGMSVDHAIVWGWQEMSKNLLDVPREHGLSKKILSRMRKTALQVRDSPNSRVYSSVAVALNNVSRACVKLGREAAGLKALNTDEAGRIKYVPEE